jgi:hypothetical protein
MVVILPELRALILMLIMAALRQTSPRFARRGGNPQIAGFLNVPEDGTRCRTAKLDANGNAVIDLPDYFMALNKDYRYIVSPISGAMHNLHLSFGVCHRYLWGLFGPPAFGIVGGMPNGEISRQVTGIRKDPLIFKNPIIVEVLKTLLTIVPRGKCLFARLCQ